VIEDCGKLQAMVYYEKEYKEISAWNAVLKLEQDLRRTCRSYVVKDTHIQICCYFIWMSVLSANILEHLSIWSSPKLVV